MIVFNNLCLEYVEITFYQVARSLTIVFNIVFAYFVWGEKTSTNCMVWYMGEWGEAVGGVVPVAPSGSKTAV
jgi:hypothetical protein